MDLGYIVAMIALVATLCSVGATTGNSINLVDILKKDLRTNNDDYIESTTTSSMSTTEAAQTLSTANDTEKVNDKYNSLSKSQKFDQKKSSLSKEINPNMYLNNRRSLNEISDAKQSNFVENEYLQPINRKITVNNIVTDNTSARNKTVTSVNTTQTTSNKVTQGHAIFRNDDQKQSDKMQNLMKFVVKNKERFNDFLNKKKIEQSLVEAQTESMSTKPKGKWYSSSEERLVRLRAFSGERPPDNDLLDMAPARGGKIHALRIKNRLCQRNVMLPEGPKYDSRGRVYLRAYTHAAARDYRLTRRPRLLLPRCCNCCKKSVLGCQ